MSKIIKKSVKILLIVLVVILSIPTFIWLTIQHSSVQTRLVGKATQIFETKFGATVHIEKFDYRPFNRILLRNVTIEDLNGDTLLSSQTVSATLTGFSLSKNMMIFHRVTLENASINFVTDTLGNMNLTEFLNNLLPKSDTTRKADDPFIINIRNFRLVESSFRMFRENGKPTDYGINFDDLYLSDILLNMKDLSIAGDTISFTISEFNAIEKSGFSIDRFRSGISFSSQHFDLEKLRFRSMGTTLNMPFLKMGFSNWDDLGDFLNLVRMNGEIQSSEITTNFLSYLVPDLKQFHESFSLSGSFRGEVSDMRIRNLEVSVAENTYLSASANVTGLPDFANTLLFIDIKDFSTNITDIESFRNFETGNSLVDLPDQFSVLKQIDFTGNFTGFLSDFVAFGNLSSSIGSISMDLSFKPGSNSLTNFKGSVSTQNFDLGLLIGDELLGKTSLSASVNGSTDYDKHLEALTDATIYAFEANGYNYTNIELSGNLSNRNFVGSLFLDDPNAKLNFMGKIDFSDTIPVFDFSAFVPRLDLVKLNLNKVDSISNASFLLTAKFTGNNLDNSRGEIKVVNGFYRNQNGEIKTSDIVINANNTADSKQIAFKSEFAEGEIRGKYNYANIFGSLQNMIYIYIPALSHNNEKPKIMPTGVDNPEFNDYIIRLRLRKTQKLTEVLFPTFRIAENTNVFGIYNPDFQTLNLKIKIPEIEISGNIIKDISIDGVTNDSSFVATISTPLLNVGGTIIRNIAINSVAKNNEIKTSFHWNNRTTIKNSGEVITNTLFTHQPGNTKVELQFNPSQFFLNDTTWNVIPSQIYLDTNLISINNFTLQNNKQQLSIQGRIASDPRDNIRVDLENIDVSNLNLYTKSLGYEFTGEIDGYAMISDLSNNPIFYADLIIDDLEINSFLIGNISFKSQWFAEDKRLSINAVNKLRDVETFDINGDFYPDNQRLDFKVKIDDIPLGLAEPFMAGEVRDLQGSIAGNITIGGVAERPLLNGSILMKEASGLIDFSRTRYRMIDPIFLENSNIVFKNFRVFDVNNRIATLNGNINTNYFKDITLDLSLAPSNFQFLNTTERDNELFYGSVFASGQARVTGKPNDIIVNASVRTEPRTAIFLPLTSSSEVAEHDFVNFINRSDEIIIIEDFFGADEVKKSNIRLTLDLQVTQEADMQIIIDKQLGDIIRANGSGNLKMEIDLSNDIFNMFGEYVIERGDYLFTLQGVINKRFRIGQGSTITWNGDVEDALMDIKAIYTLRTTLSPLSPGSQDDIYNRRTQVDCQINLTGKLMEPTIGFDIIVPIAESDPNVNAVVLDALNTEERISKQFLSLLVINSFTSDVESQAAGSFSQGLASTAGEMLSNQLSNWLSQWTNAVDIGVNWRPGDEISSNEIELALSTQLFNDRVTLNSNVDMGNQNVNSVIAGDFSIDVKIVPSGKLRVKAFARSNDDLFYGGSNQNDLTTGAGFMYREDFNTLGELWERYKKIFTRKKDPEYVYYNPDPENNNN